MSDSKKDQNEDIVASAEDAPEIIGDEKLEDAAGGWSWGSSLRTTNVVMSGGSTMLTTDPTAATVGAGSGNDTLIGTADINMLRTRPGRIGNPYGG